jgi:hypothetical protein
MSDSEIVLLVSRLATGAIATFLAIILWSRTRDTAWMLIVIGTVASYADILYATLDNLGVIQEAALSLGGIPIAKILFANLPSLFFSLGFAIMISRKKLG